MKTFGQAMCTRWPGDEQQLGCSGEGVPSSQPGEATRNNSCGPTHQLQLAALAKLQSVHSPP